MKAGGAGGYESLFRSDNLTGLFGESKRASLVALRTGILAGEGLTHDARLVVMAALTKDPDEPSLHVLLGQLYQKAGLPGRTERAAEENR